MNAALKISISLKNSIIKDDAMFWSLQQIFMGEEVSSVFFKSKWINQYLGKFSGGIYNIGTWTFIYIFKDTVAKLII